MKGLRIAIMNGKIADHDHRDAEKGFHGSILCANWAVERNLQISL
jgi:hypothetical protein